MTRCGRRSRASAGTPVPAATGGSPGPVTTRPCGSGSPARPPRVASTSPRTAPATSGRGGATRTPRWRPATRAGPRLAPGLRPRRRRVRRPARRRVRLRRARPAGGAGVHAGPADRHRQLRRRGGCPVRHRLRGVAAADRPARPPTGPGRCATPTASPWPRRWPRPGTTRPTSAPTPRRCAGSARSSSCTSSRAGPWSTSADPVGVGVGDLAARPVAARPGGRGQPRGHHPAGGPPRPDAGAAPRPCSAARSAAERTAASRPWARCWWSRAASTPSRPG